MPDGSYMITVLFNNKLMRKKTQVFRRRKRYLKDSDTSLRKQHEVSKQDLVAFKEQLKAEQKAAKRKWIFVWCLIGIIIAAFVYAMYKFIRYIQ